MITKKNNEDNRKSIKANNSKSESIQLFSNNLSQQNLDNLNHDTKLTRNPSAINSEMKIDIGIKKTRNSNIYKSHDNILFENVNTINTNSQEKNHHNIIQYKNKDDKNDDLKLNEIQIDLENREAINNFEKKRASLAEKEKILTQKEYP